MSDSFNRTVSDYQQIIRRHSKSFSLAARLLPRGVRDDVQKLYAWCRLCDDAVDNAPSRTEASRRLQVLREDVERIYANQPTKHAASQWLAELVVQFAIPERYPLALLDGMETDLKVVCIRDEEELLLYCHRAAGTVGLMMCSLFDVAEPYALRCADSLGIAMQLTNIARDVREDWAAGRCYLPASWFEKPPERDQRLTNEIVREPVERILKLADQHYQRGLRGLPYLPPNCELSIRVAAIIYREIGEVVRQRDFCVMDGRAYVPLRRKVGLVAAALGLGLFLRIKGRTSDSAQNSSISDQFTSTLGNVMSKEAQYNATLGLSLSAILAAAMFVMVAFNPKDAATYSYLPWIYATGCAVTGLTTQWLMRRMEIKDQPILVPVEVERSRRQAGH